MKTFNIGELSEKSGVASHAIRFYERENLMPEPAKKQLEKIRHQIQSLSRIEAVLSETLEECSGEGPMDGCPIVEAIAQRG